MSDEGKWLLLGFLLVLLCLVLAIVTGIAPVEPAWR